MTRKEYIQKLIDEETGIDNYGSSDYQMGVCDGVRLADKTMLDKACEWIAKNHHMYKELSFGSLSTDWHKLIKEFRKAMEE